MDRRIRRAGGSTFGRWRTAFASAMIAAMLRGLCLVPVLALAACASAPQAPLMWSAADAANWRAEQITLNDAKGKPLRHVSRESVRRLVDAEAKLEGAAGIHAGLYLAQGDDPNGYSYPGADGKNYVAVTVPMLEIIGDDEAEAAALLGHELAHLALGHRKKREERASVNSAASVAAGIALTLAHVPMGASAADVAGNAISSAYSRDEEREADARSLDYMRAAGFDPSGAVRLWEKLAKINPQGGPLSFLNDHPASAERLEAMRSAAASANPAR